MDGWKECKKEKKKKNSTWNIIINHIQKHFYDKLPKEHLDKFFSLLKENLFVVVADDVNATVCAIFVCFENEKDCGLYKENCFTRVV